MICPSFLQFAVERSDMRDALNALNAWVDQDRDAQQELQSTSDAINAEEQTLGELTRRLHKFNDDHPGI